MDTIAQIMSGFIAAVLVGALGWIYAKYVFRFRAKVSRRAEISPIALEEKTTELGATGEELTAALMRFLESFGAGLERRIEKLSLEAHSSRIKMIYSSRAKALEPMETAIMEANSFVYIMGISLREFFQLDTRCSTAIAKVYNSRKDVKLKVLILDNRSLEAMERSCREEGVAFRGVDDPEYKSRTLFVETRNTIRNIQRYFPGTALRVYDHQSLFLLITDKVAFVEPYHYGDRVIGEPPMQAAYLRRVAELVPLIEFEKATERGPYEQFLGHFEYVFDNAKEPTEENVRI